jgi:hypothetical protein
MTILAAPAGLPSRSRGEGWTAELVKQRLKEAFAVLQRLPGDGLRRVGPAWPAQPMHSFADVVGWDNAGDGPSDRVLADWAHSRGATSREVSRMEEALDWLRWLEGDELVWLQAWANAKRLSKRRMLQKRGLSRTSFYRTIELAARRIADRLNERGVVVR